MDLNDEIENFWNSTYFLNKSDDECNKYFVKGFISGKNDKDFIDLIRDFLNIIHSIDNRYFTLIEMIEYYSSSREMNLINGFYDILNEIKRSNFNLLKGSNVYRKKEEDVTDFFYRKLGKEIVHNYVKKGDVISIKNKIKDGYRDTKFFDSSLKNPSWDILYPDKHNDFQHINFYYKENEQITYWGPLWRIFGNFKPRVEKVVVENSNIVVYTAFFRIEYEGAIENGEIELSNESISYEPCIEDLIENVKYFSSGISEYTNLNFLVGDWCFNNFQKLNFPWQNYYRRINGFWDRIEKADVKINKDITSTAKNIINLKSNANEKHHFTLNIENASKNVFAITNIESENDDTFKEGNWVFILFAGYSGLDIKFVKEFISITTEFPNLNFAFKPYMDDEKIQEFTQVNIERKRTPVIILKKNSDSKLLSDTTKNIEKIKTLLYSI
ncbi:MAG: hypothetical protein MK202_17035 [Tenacibaculum sp.]|nr:hypothetical protein [Tenacibaculum sp.]